MNSVISYMLDFLWLSVDYLFTFKKKYKFMEPLRE
jgi:hypothetical protein